MIYAKFFKKFCLVMPIAFALTAQGKQRPSEVRFHDEANDTTRITKILIESENINDPNARIMSIAERFIDVPYVGGTLETYPDVERLTVNLDELDCTTFVESVLAMAITAGEHRTSWHDYLNNLEGTYYRGGELEGYPSRLHYFSDWIVDNVHRGNIVEETSAFPDYRTMTKTLDFMSRNAELYPALADSANLAGIKNAEMGYRNHRYPYIPSSSVNNKGVRDKFKDGDIVAILSRKNGLDIAHVGFIVKDDKGIPYLFHASSKGGKVMRDKLSLFEYLKKNNNPGIRILRIKD